MPDPLFIFILAILSAVVGAIIGKTRGLPVMGAIAGLLLGPLGWLAIYFSDNRPQCPQCRGRVPSDARKCQHCGSELTVWVPIKCPACGETGKVSEQTALESIECPACQRHFRVPAVK